MIRDRANRRFAGTLLFDSLFRPHLINDQNVYHGTKRLALFLVSLYVLSLVIFSAFNSLLFPLCLGGLGLLFVLILTLFIGYRQGVARMVVSLMAYKVLISSALLVVVAIRGPFYFWYHMWTSDLFKTLFLALFIMLLFRKFQVYLIMGKQWRGGRGAGALVFLALGIQGLIAGIALWAFGLETSLTALNDQLLILPGGLRVV